MRRRWGSCFLILAFLVVTMSLEVCGAPSEEETTALLEIKAALGLGNGVLYGWGIGVNSTSPCNWERVLCDKNTFQLTGLNLTSLSLAGMIPPSIAELSSLQILDLSDNNITGFIPVEIGSCSNLSHIDLSDNSLYGEIPDAISQLRQLSYLSLQSNHLSGQIPASLSGLSKLNHLDLSYNRFSGEIPPLIYWSQTLEVLNFRSNFLTGGISPDICKLTSVWFFSVRENNLTGTIPSSIGNCSSFQILDLGYNQLSGHIPRNFGFLQVSTLSLENNQLTGWIPDVLGLLQALIILDLSKNQLEGPIPDSLGNLTFLNKIYLHENLLTGNIPPVLANMTGMKYMLLDDNGLSGPLPSEFGRMHLFELRLANNQLEGLLPASLSACTSLNTLDLHGNKFSGAIPPELERLDNLTHLNLSFNSFTGRIPKELANVINLDSLDLSYNNLSGQIPSAVGKLEHLLVFFLQGNQLSGGIPSAFGNLTSLMQLDVSHNALSGSIPPQLGHLQQLSMLLLDHNNLSGVIPLELTGCIMLTILNVSYNNLQGSLPMAGTFGRFPESSFLGNPGLCGNQVQRGCRWRGEKSSNAVGSSTIWAVTAVAVFLLAIAIFAIFKSSQLRRPVTPVDISGEGPPRLILYHMGLAVESYGELVHITDNLTEQSVVGSGASSKVYKCTLKNGQTVAVKKLYNHHAQNIQEFQNELQMLEKIKHRNLVTLRGYSLSSLGHFLVYDFMENGSLYDLLHGSAKKIKLDWSSRLNIALGAAQGLAYLHHDCKPRIVHRDIKSGNILLDAKLDAHISDFGIAKNVQMSASYTSTFVMGTIGYIDPEYARTSMLNEKSDVYSYGIVLLELLTDRTAVNSEGNLLSWVLHKVDSNTMLAAVSTDARSSCSSVHSIEKVLKLALLCTDKDPKSRPSMYDVVQVLLLALTSGPVLNHSDFMQQKVFHPARQQQIEMYLNPMYYNKSSLGSSDSSITDGQLLARFGEVISKHDP